MIGFFIALLSGALMSIQGVFNTQVTKTSGIWVANAFVQFPMPSLPVFISLCRNLKVSPSYLLSEELKDHSIQEMDLLFSLWQRATPKQIKLITSMVKCALETLDGWEE